MQFLMGDKMKLSKKLRLLFGGVMGLTIVLYIASSQIMVNYLYTGEMNRITGISSGCVGRLEGQINKIVGEGYKYKSLLIANNKLITKYKINAMDDLEILKEFEKDEFDYNIILDNQYNVKYLVGSGNEKMYKDLELEHYLASKLPVRTPVTGVVTTSQNNYIITMMSLSQDINSKELENKYFIGVRRIDRKFIKSVEGNTDKNIDIVRSIDQEKKLQVVPIMTNKQLLLYYGEDSIEAYYAITQLNEGGNIYLKIVEPLVVQTSTKKNIMIFTVLLIILCSGIYSGLWVIINKIIISPIKQLNEGINTIKSSGKLNKRLLETNETDEISVLTQDINKMFDSLEQAQMQKDKKDKRYETLLNTMTNAYATCKVVYDERRHIGDIICIECNEAMAKLLGASVSDIRADMTQYIEMNKMLLEQLRTVLHDIQIKQVPYYIEEVQVGKNIWGQVCIFSLEEDQFSIIITDITKIKQYSEQMKYMANYDVLTGLKNRYSLYEYVKQLIDDKKEFSVYFMDLDNFKKLNDTIGHTEGDKILCIVAEELKRFSDANTFVSRVGGDEFIVIRRNEGEAGEITQFGEAIIKSLNTQFNYRWYNFELKVSIGVSLYPFNGQDIECLLKYADIAMYQSKSKGGNRLEIFNDKMLEHMEIENKLKQAIENKEFVAYYQPIYNLEKKQIVGAEALVRWIEEGVIIPPNKFISIAKYTGDIVAIDYFMLDQACAFSKEWRMKGYDTFSVSVNMSYRALNHPEFLETVQESLNNYNLSPAAIKIEITEDEVIDSPKQIVDILNQLREMGVRISLDDFGVGYSSFNHIKMLPIDTLKVDRSLIFKLEKDDKTLSIIETLIGLAHNLGLDVICEGIELEEQIDKLQGIGCDNIQGYYISQPIQPKLFEQYMFYYENRQKGKNIQI